ncbi:MAG TPA: 2'-5' RNA ligase family protein [Sphingomicrobium sp.]|nr:2'-5' RNA ligase family protein [Sphingomicrobium sp.]
MAGALIVTAEIAPRDLTWLDQLRRTYYPAERNRLPAHLTMFHALPPSSEGEVRRALSRCSSERPPQASIEGLMDLGGGVAFRIVSTDLDRVRRELATDFHGLLSAQDAGGWRPHVTIQNKVAPTEARALMSRLDADFRPRPLAVSGLGLHRYLGGPWEELAVYAFRGR